MSKFFKGSSDSSASDALIAQQEKEAREAERKETERQARLKSGREMIKAMFSEEGGTYTTPKTWGELPMPEPSPNAAPATSSTLGTLATSAATPASRAVRYATPAPNPGMPQLPAPLPNRAPTPTLSDRDRAQMYTQMGYGDRGGVNYWYPPVARPQTAIAPTIPASSYTQMGTEGRGGVSYPYATHNATAVSPKAQQVQLLVDIANGGKGSPASPPKPEYGWIDGKKKKVEGIGTDFYDNFMQSILDFYTPEVERQYENAAKQNLFDLARRSMVRSSVASDRAGELAEDKAMAEAKVQSDAEGQVAGLKRDMSNAKQNALTLLQQTEDPTAAADAALTEVNAVKSTAPRFDPLGEMFRAAALGYTSYRDAQAAKRYRDAVPTTNPYTSSGRNVS